MKVLVVGSGGREHALVWKLARDASGSGSAVQILCAPGNAGIAELARCVPIAAGDVQELAKLAERERPQLTIVGPEAPLAAGIVNLFTERGLPIFGPTAQAARLESSKTFAKAVMDEAGVPTARARSFTDAAAAKRAARELGAPVVIKASGLAAGKGVVVARTLSEADAAIDDMLERRSLGDAGGELLVEEFMAGEELSLFALTDGRIALPMPFVQDHKRLRNGDGGPNTGGMGAYSPVSIGTPELRDRAMREIIHPTLRRMRERGTPFTGLLYAGLMITDAGPRVVEFNCRFGDPETQALLPLLVSPLLPALEACARGTLDGTELTWSDGAATTVVVAAPGYPERPVTGQPLAVGAPPADVIVFHAGTRRDADGRLRSAGGRVLAVTALGDSVDEAAERSRRFAETIELDGKQFRRDIAWRERARVAGAA